MGPPSEINLNVPFFPQAPDADWGLPWQEACEEAASVLAWYYVTGQPLTKEQFKEEVLALVGWQKEHFGDYKHSNIEQTAMMIKGHFLDLSSANIQMALIEEPTVGELKEFIADGYVVIAPFAGRQLGNPFYSGEGPLYHMMVIKGYDKKHFITNDVGTKRGENFIYPYQTILSAMHEWHDTNINLGMRKVIVLK
ncbi:C39 family peptidase [Candidatus Peregrinibacteria bacterium]|nr:C39 family peptidase [Candidatus Peregrinibacteria bacterium]